MSGASIGVLDSAFLPREGRIAKPSLCADLGLQMWPADKLRPTVKGDGSAGDKRQIFDCFDDLTHHGFRALVEVFLDRRETADTLTSEVTLACPSFCLKNKITFPVPDLATVRHIIRAKQNADIAVEIGFSTSAGSPRPAGNTVSG
jgi:hypothetical protein